MANCLNCGKELIGTQKYACSNKCSCRVYYRKNKQMFIQKAREWDLKNPEKRKISLKKALAKYFKSQKGKEKRKNWYKRNKTQELSRALTRFLLGRDNHKKQIFPKKICKMCGSRKNLELHHEKYSPTINEIIKDWENGLIYYLCRKHHRGLNGIHSPKEIQEVSNS